MSDKIPGATTDQKHAFLKSDKNNIDVAQFLKTVALGQYKKILYDALSLEANDLPPKLPEGHEKLIRLQLKTVITANFDQLFEFMYESLFRKLPQVILTANQLVNRKLSSSDTTLIKMHGCISDFETMVLAREDHACAWQEKRESFNFIKRELQTATCLFLGYSLSDTNFNFIYDEVRYLSPTRAGKLNYTVVSAEDLTINPLIRTYWSTREMQLIALQSWASLDGLLIELYQRLRS